MGQRFPGKTQRRPGLTLPLHRTLCGVTVAVEMLLVVVCFCISLLTHPSVSPCVSLLPPPPPAVQPGAMAAEEVTCGIFSGLPFAMLVASRCRGGGGGGGGLFVVPLSAFHLCCDLIKP